MLMETRPQGSGGGGDEPWLHEPNRVAWRDLATGYQCLILRTELGNLNGYVRVPRGHALHGRSFHERRVYRDVFVHGGLSFSGCLGGRNMKRGHWFGFDCAHFRDLVPAMQAAMDLFGLPGMKFATYRTVSYVRGECQELAHQLARKA
jgi:hypothetical protein